MNKVGQFIKKRREEKNWTMHKLSRKSGVSYTEVRSIEIGERKNPSIHKLNEIAIALCVPKEELLVEAGYIKKKDEIPLTEKLFLNLKNENQRKTVQKIVDFLVFYPELKEIDYEDLTEFVELFIKQRNRLITRNKKSKVVLNCL